MQPQRPRIAHHLHVAAQVLAAIDHDIPSMVLIRRPLDAVSSLLIREPGLKPARVIAQYQAFYEPLLPRADRFVLAPFDTVTADFGAVIERLNERFHTNFVPYEHSDDLERRVMARIDEIDRTSVRGALDESRVSRPSDQRVSAAARLREQLREHRDMRAAERLYERFMDSVEPWRSRSSP